MLFSLFNDYVHYIILIVAFVKCYNRDKHDILIFAKLFIVALANFGLKDLAGQIIPKITQSDFILRKLVYRPGTTTSGLPSGHCMIIFSIIPLLTKIYRQYIINLILLYGIFIGYDRVRKEKHTYLQVIIGALVGWGMGYRLF